MKGPATGLVSAAHLMEGPAIGLACQRTSQRALTLSWPQSTYIGRDETGSVYLPTQVERALQLYW